MLDGLCWRCRCLYRPAKPFADYLQKVIAGKVAAAKPTPADLKVWPDATWQLIAALKAHAQLSETCHHKHRFLAHALASKSR